MIKKVTYKISKFMWMCISKRSEKDYELGPFPLPLLIKSKMRNHVPAYRQDWSTVSDEHWVDEGFLPFVMDISSSLTTTIREWVALWYLLGTQIVQSHKLRSDDTNWGGRLAKLQENGIQNLQFIDDPVTVMWLSLATIWISLVFW